MIYELRIYHMHPGKMEDIHKRFREKTISLFQRHGMNVVDFWEDAEGRSTIYYVLEHPDAESRNRNFEAFQKDPEWMETRRQSELGGPIVERVESYLMTRVPYFSK